MVTCICYNFGGGGDIAEGINEQISCFNEVINQHMYLQCRESLIRFLVGFSWWCWIWWCGVHYGGGWIFHFDGRGCEIDGGEANATAYCQYVVVSTNKERVMKIVVMAVVAAPGATRAGWGCWEAFLFFIFIFFIFFYFILYLFLLKLLCFVHFALAILTHKACICKVNRILDCFCLSGLW